MKEHGLGNTAKMFGSDFGKSAGDFFGSFAGKATIAIASVTALMVALDLLNTSQAEALEKARNSATKAANSQAEVESIQSELDSIAQRVEEINANPLTLTDKSELESLQEQSAELEKISVLKQRQAEIDTKQAANDASDALNKKGIVNTTGYDWMNFVESDWYNNLAMFTAPHLVAGGSTPVQKAIIEVGELLELENKKAGYLADENLKKAEATEKKIVSRMQSLTAQYDTLKELRESLDDSVPEQAEIIKTLDDLVFPSIDYSLGVTDLQKQAKAISEIFSDNTFAESQQKLVDSLREGNEITLDNLKSQFPELVAACDKAGISAETLLNELQALATQEGGMTNIERDISATTSAIEAQIDAMAQLQSIMAESNSGKGMSKESVANFKAMFGADAETALERTASGYRVNEQALQSLQKQQDALTKSDYLTQMSNQYDRLRDAKEDLARAEAFGEDTSGFELAISGIQDQISSLDEVIYRYDAANSAFNRWQASLSGGENGDMFESIKSGAEQAQKRYDAGEVGTNDFRAYTQLFTYEDLSNKSNSEVGQAYENATTRIKRYADASKDARELVGNLLTDMQAYDSNMVSFNQDANAWDIDFSKGNFEALKEHLNLSEDFINSSLLKGTDLGDFNINLTESTATLAELKTKALESAAALKEMGDSSLSLNFEAGSLESVGTEIEKIEKYIENINTSDIAPNVKADKLSEAHDMLAYFVSKQAELEESSEVSISFDVKADELNSAIDTMSKVKDRTIEMDIEANTIGFDIELAALKSQIESWSPEVKATLGVSNLSTEEIMAGIRNETITIPTKIEPPATSELPQFPLLPLSTEVNYKKGEQEEPEKMDATVDYLMGLQAPPTSPLTATVNYTLGTVAKPPAINVGMNITTPFNGTAHANGTANIPNFRGSAYAMGSAYSSGNWGIPKNETALAGELGRELVVSSNGTYRTVGDNGAEMTSLKRGDVVFNHLQTREILSKGYVTSGGGRAKVVGGNSAFAHGSAYVSGTNGGGGFYVPKSSYSSTTSKKSNTSSSKSTTKATDSASTATDGALDDLSKFFDWIAIQMSRLQKNTKSAENAIKSAIGLADTQLKTANAINKVQEEMNVARQGYDRYLSHASWYASNSGLSANLQTQVQNGTIDITKLDDDTQKKVSEYQSWYIKMPLYLAISNDKFI